MKAIIHQPIENLQRTSWQTALRTLITCPKELMGILELDEKALDWAVSDFPLRVTRSFVLRMKKGDPHDPLLRQVLTRKSENELFEGFCPQPLKENSVNPIPGLLHKFQNRALVILTSSCAIHCRYCFRRHFPYQQNNVGRNWQAILDYIQANTQIEEIILSGGDPLMASNDTIALFLEEISAIKHVEFVRFHTRLPVVIPERIEPKLIKTLATTRFNIAMVYHINHANEITPEIAQGVTLLKHKNVTVLNQSVLLNGVNDDAQTLIYLSKTLYKAGILPYYINLLDKVEGAHEFRTSTAKAKSLQSTLRASLPGYLVPRFVQEIPNLKFKLPLDLIEA